MYYTQVHIRQNVEAIVQSVCHEGIVKRRTPRAFK